MPLLHKTWNDFFDAKANEEGPFKTLANGSFDPFNSATRRHLDSAGMLLSSVVASKYNFFLIAGADRNIQLVHSLILVSPSLGENPILLGIQGNRAVSPLKVISTDPIITKIRKSRGAGRADKRWTMPSMEQFLHRDGSRRFREPNRKKGGHY